MQLNGSPLFTLINTQRKAGRITVQSHMIFRWIRSTFVHTVSFSLGIRFGSWACWKHAFKAFTPSCKTAQCSVSQSGFVNLSRLLLVCASSGFHVCLPVCFTHITGGQTMLNWSVFGLLACYRCYHMSWFAACKSKVLVWLRSQICICGQCFNSKQFKTPATTNPSCMHGVFLK